MRYYAQVTFLNIREYGLLDTGANISCIGGELALNDFSKFSNISKCKSNVRTADGNLQNVNGWIEVDVTFKGETRPLKIFIIPSIAQKLILGIDFCKAFNLIPDIIGTVGMIASDD